MRFEVQTDTICDGWINCWTWTDWNNEEYPETFETYDEAMAAIHEFFADLWRAGMGQDYDMKDYRVEVVDP